MITFILSYLKKFYLITCTLVKDEDMGTAEWKIEAVRCLSDHQKDMMPLTTFGLDSILFEHIEVFLGDPDDHEGPFVVGSCINLAQRSMVYGMEIINGYIVRDTTHEWVSAKDYYDISNTYMMHENEPDEQDDEPMSARYDDV